MDICNSRVASATDKKVVKKTYFYNYESRVASATDKKVVKQTYFGMTTTSPFFLENCSLIWR